MRGRAFATMTALAVLVGCSNDPTPAGTRILSAETAARIPEEARPRLVPVGHHAQTVRAGPGQIRIAFEMFRDRADQTLYLDHVSAEVADAGGCTYRARSIPPSVFHTEDPPEMTMVVAFECERLSTIGSRTVESSSFKLHANGSVSAR